MPNYTLAKGYFKKRGQVIDPVYAGVLNKKGTAFLHKTDVTSQFLQIVIDQFLGYDTKVTCGKKIYHVRVTKTRRKI
jgi:hypothetical protein